ncbi:MAG TPA: adenylate/guanylate cyclase domain-containing protein [Anaerolineae bacterium]|nr:adenylate/guanylate cyclase domain-containing protein [Anaerolineae bacterium]
MSNFSATILVVDDDSLNRIILQTNLVNSGHEVVLAENGEEALAYLEEQTFDLVLLDLYMPVCDGFEVLARMKANEKLRLLPVIVISADDDVDSVVRCIEMGATDHLPKPFNQTLLQARIQASLESKRLLDLEKVYLQKIEEEKAKSERLLLSILPAPVAEELKQGRQTIGKYHESVTILFADLVNFTHFTAQNSSDQVIETINIIFSAFDGLVAEHKLEKIKTLGDAYMVAGGLPLPREDHAGAIFALAQAMLAEFQRLHREGLVSKQLGIRMGMHSGPVIAGVVGQKKFAYDLWGETVVVADALEATGLPGRLLLSAATRELLPVRESFEPYGSIEIETVGKVNAFLY